MSPTSRYGTIPNPATEFAASSKPRRLTSSGRETTSESCPPTVWWRVSTPRATATVSRTNSSYVIADVDRLYGFGLRTSRLTRTRPPNGLRLSNATPRKVTVGEVKRCFTADEQPTMPKTRATPRIRERTRMRRIYRGITSDGPDRWSSFVADSPSIGASVHLFRFAGAALSALLAVHAASAQQSRADLVLLHGDLVTVDSQHPRAQ